MITLEVGKRYKTNDNAQVTCVYRNDKSMFLMVVDGTNLTFWSTENGTCVLGVMLVKEIPQRQTAVGYVNIYRHYGGELYMGEFRYSSDEAKAAALDGRVGVVRVELVNNIETGEVEV